MKHKIVIHAGTTFEFEGEITELTEDHILLQAKHSEIYIERKHLVFIQSINEEPVKQEEYVAPPKQHVSPPKVDGIARFINKNLKHDPLEDRLDTELRMAFVPPSQLPDGNPDDYYGYLARQAENDEDGEVVRSISKAITGKETPPDLEHALKAAMQRTSDDDFSMSPNGGNVKYKNPADMFLRKSNADSKETKDS